VQAARVKGQVARVRAVKGLRRAATARALALVGAALLLATASLALAEDPTRESYTAAVEPICKKNTMANERILKGARKRVQQGKLKPASKQFLRASRALKKTYRQLKAVPQPPADAATLAKWLRYVKIEADLFAKTGKALKSGNKFQAQKMVLKLTDNANKANNTVFNFDFRYCRFEPAKFT
jgi:hypothetical protein